MLMKYCISYMSLSLHTFSENCINLHPSINHYMFLVKYSITLKLRNFPKATKQKLPTGKKEGN